MFNIGMGEGVVIALALLIVMGPERLPGLARNLGKILHDLRKETDEVRGTVLREIYRLRDDIDSDVELPRRPAIAARAMAVLTRTDVVDPNAAPPAPAPEPKILAQPAEGAIARNAVPPPAERADVPAQPEGGVGPVRPESRADAPPVQPERSAERGVEGSEHPCDRDPPSQTALHGDSSSADPSTPPLRGDAQGEREAPPVTVASRDEEASRR